VNTSVTVINLDTTGVSYEDVLSINALLDRNQRLRRLFLFDARQMLLSVLCADDCVVVWPFLLKGDNLAAVKARNVAETIRAEFAVVVEERRRRAAAAVQLVTAEVDDKGDSRAVKRRRTKRRALPTHSDDRESCGSAYSRVRPTVRGTQDGGR
jgi:hypothetical protein